jgi:flagellar protein FliS
MNPYFEQNILNAEPVELTRMIYRQAIASVREAREHPAQRQIRERAEAINRAYSAIAELLVSLRPEAAPELSARLQSLYSYMLRRLLDGNMQQVDPPLAEVLGLLVTLEEAWSGVAAKLKPQNEIGEPSAEVPRDSLASRWNHAGAGLEEGARLALTA